MLKERNKRSCYRHNLLRRYIHPVDLVRRSCGVVLVGSYRYITLEDEVLARLLYICVTLGDCALLFIVDIKILGLFIVHEDNSVKNLSVRSLDEAELVDLCIVSKSEDKTDVSTFRSFNRTDLAVVSVVYVSYVEELAGIVPLDTTLRTDGTDSSLVGQLSKRVDLVHELGKLG